MHIRTVKFFLNTHVGMALASLCIWTGAIAADNPAPPPKPLPPIPLNSGVSPQEFSADVSKVTLEHKADGTRIYHLNGQGMQSVIAHIGADGKIHFECTDQAEKMAQGAKAGNNHDK